MINFKEYSSKVMDAYFKDFGGIVVSNYLEVPSEKKIMNAAIDLLETEKRYLERDKRILNNFLNLGRKDSFVQYHKEQDFVKALRGQPSSKYKAIYMYIKRYKEEPESRTDAINLDFIAWLIDFRPRPHSSQFEQKFQERKLEEFADQLQEVLKSEKEIQILKTLFFNENVLKNFKEMVLKEVLMEYQLEDNPSFQRYRKQIADDMAMQAFTINKLKAKISVLRNQLKKARWTKRFFGTVGLFFVTIDYKEPTLDDLFDSLSEIYSEIEVEDEWLDDLI